MKNIRINKIVFITLSISIAFTIFSCQEKEELKKPNVLFICIDDLRPELKSFGADYIYSPNIDKLAASGVSFIRHFVNAPSCGPSRYTLLTGQYGPAGNNALFNRAESIQKGEQKNDPSMPEWFRMNGYKTVSVGKVSHHPGGMGGKVWNDRTIIEIPEAWDRQIMPVGDWQHPRGMMHGLANGEIRINPSEMDVIQATEGPDNIYPDGIITEEALNQLKTLSKDEKPFFLAVGILKPHLPFGAPKSYSDQYIDVEFPPVPHPEKPKGRTTWHQSGEFKQYNRWEKDANTNQEFSKELRKHYAACVSYADAQVGKILDELAKSEASKNTIIVLWGDHGWHLGEHSIWGKHSLFEESLRSPLIISYPDLKNRGSKTNAVVETLDLFPTLCDLSGMKTPEYTQGVSLRPILQNPKSFGHPSLSYINGAKTLRTDSHRLIVHDDGFFELYDHESPEKETKNIASENPDLAKELESILISKLGS